MKKELLPLIILLAILTISCEKKNEDSAKADRITRQGFSMGTNLEIQIVTDDFNNGNTAITAAFVEIQRINDKYSTYQTENYIWDMNQADTFMVDDETAYLLQMCDSIHNLTEGRFDAAVGNLIDLIGFEGKNPHLPPQDSIDMILAKTGWKNVDISKLPMLIKKNGVAINFGGIAKGYAVDRASEVVRSFGFDVYMVNAGGEIQAKGKDWSVGISHPRKQGDILGAVMLKDISIATSGDYEQFFKQDEKRYSHIIDPVTGIPSNTCQAVSIVCDDCIFADGIATGIFLLGPEKGIEIANGIADIEALVVSSEGKISESNGFVNYFQK
jgi:thiamine biosynthesis lipoprotein